MDLILKQLIIIAGTFLVIMWFQNVDDRKHNKTRDTFYEKYKFPILVSAIVGFVINIPEIISSVTGQQCDSGVTEIAIFTSGEQINQINPVKQISKNVGKLSPIDIVKQNTRNVISEQQIYTDLPDF